MISSFDVESPAFVAIRFAQFVALLIVIGATVFSRVVLVRAARGLDARAIANGRARAAVVALGATLALGVTALMRLLAQCYAIGGDNVAPDRALVRTLVTVTQWGHAWLIEMAAILLALLAFAAARRQHMHGWTLAFVASGALALSMALSGHAVTVPTLRNAALLADALHIVGGSGWLGSLLFVIVVGIPVAHEGDDSQRWHRVAAVVDAFSHSALVFAALSAVTGMFAASQHLDTLSALSQTRYGRLLLFKLAVLSVTAGIGLYNWQLVKPMLNTGPVGTHRLRRSAAAELTIGAVVLLITAILVATPTGMSE